MSNTSQSTNEQPNADAHSYQHGPHYGPYGRDPFAWAKTPGFHPLKAAAVVGGLAIFPPLGLAALAYFVLSSRRQWREGAAAPYAFAGAGGPPWARRGGCGRSARWSSGNAAFDEHRAQVMDELAKEQQDFASAQAAERRKRDLEAFEAFKAGRASGTPASGTVL